MSVSVCQLQPYQTSSSPYAYPLPLAFTIAGGPSTGTSELRKRTTSFSCPAAGSSRPRKRLHRTESIVDLTLIATTASATGPTPLTTPLPVPYNRTLKFYKEQKERRRAGLRRDTSPVPDSSSLSLTGSRGTPLSHPPVPSSFSSVHSISPLSPRSPVQHARQPPTSPLARYDVPVPSHIHARAVVLPPRASSQLACGPAHPPPPSARVRSKPKAPADLHRRALTTCMRATPEGAKILHMGARLAVGIMAATHELERMCDEASTSDVALLEGEEDALGEIDEEDVAAAEAIACADADVQMADADSEPDSESEQEPMPAMSSSWVVVGNGPAVRCGREIMREYGMQREREDWEMISVECVA